MRLVVTGSSGFLGSALIPFISTRGHAVTRLVRSSPREGEIHWDPGAGRVNGAALEGVEAVIHLAGDNIATGRWTAAKKARIRDSRVRGTRLLSEALASLKSPPKALLCASGCGYYGDRGEEILTEASLPGSDFLADMCREWEAACTPAVEKGIRVVNLRFGMVLHSTAGALRKMVPPFKMGVGGKLGFGRQYMSWVAIGDVLGAIDHILSTPEIKGPVNVVTPQPVTNEEFTKTLGKTLSRPTIFSVPAFALRLALGELADMVLLASHRVQPERLLASGYSFLYPELEGALRHLLGRTAP